MRYPAKPLEQKRALGNPGKRSLVPEDETLKVAATTAVPQAPSHLVGVGLEAWETVWTKCAEWVSPDLDTNIILRYCENLQLRELLLEAVLADGVMTDGKPHAALTKIKDLEAMLSRAESRLALNPADRARMGFIEIQKANALESFLAKQDATPERRDAIETGIANDTDDS